MSHGSRTGNPLKRIWQSDSWPIKIDNFILDGESAVMFYCTLAVEFPSGRLRLLVRLNSLRSKLCLAATTTRIPGKLR